MQFTGVGQTDSTRDGGNLSRKMAVAESARPMMTSYPADFSVKSAFQSPRQLPLSRRVLIRPVLPATAIKKRGSSICCLVSGVDGGGVSDEFVSTRKSGFGREFSALAIMLKRIEPLDNSIISKGVSEAAKESMKQTISTMLGLLPSDQFSVTVRVSRRPLDRLIVSSIVTGYTLWNAEYRISLMRNFSMSSRFKLSNEDGDLVVSCEEREFRESKIGGGEEMDSPDLKNLGKLSPEALSYIHQLEMELSMIKKVVNSQRNENLRIEHIKKSNNNLLEYLRSLQSDMVTELSRPSSPEVEEIIHQLAQNTILRFFKDVTVSDYSMDSENGSIQNHQSMDDNELCDPVGTSRDSLARLLFWCMLLGHHLRGLENRLQLSCVVGLL